MDAPTECEEGHEGDDGNVKYQKRVHLGRGVFGVLSRGPEWASPFLCRGCELCLS